MFHWLEASTMVHTILKSPGFFEWDLISPWNFKRHSQCLQKKMDNLLLSLMLWERWQDAQGKGEEGYSLEWGYVCSTLLETLSGPIQKSIPCSRPDNNQELPWPAFIKKIVTRASITDVQCDVWCPLLENYFEKSWNFVCQKLYELW